MHPFVLPFEMIHGWYLTEVPTLMKVKLYAIILTDSEECRGRGIRPRIFFQNDSPGT